MQIGVIDDVFGDHRWNHDDFFFENVSEKKVCIKFLPPTPSLAPQSAPYPLPPPPHLIVNIIVTSSCSSTSRISWLYAAWCHDDVHDDIKHQCQRYAIKWEPTIRKYDHENIRSANSNDFLSENICCNCSCSLQQSIAANRKAWSTIYRLVIRTALNRTLKKYKFIAIGWYLKLLGIKGRICSFKKKLKTRLYLLYVQN